MKVLSDLIVRYLHIITKLNFHREELSRRNSILYKARHPWKCVKDSVDLYFFQKNCTHFLSLHGEVQQFERAKQIHQQMSSLLGNKRTFFDKQLPNEESTDDEVEVERSGTPDELPKLTSFDILAYVYLKEELVNTPDSVEVKYLSEKYGNLV